MSVIGELTAILGLDTDNFQKNWNRTINRVDLLGERMVDLGGRMTAGVTVPITGAALAGVHFANQLNAGMANVESLIPGATGRVIELKKNVKEMSVSVGADTEQLTGALYQTVSAFGDTADTAEILKINAMAAKGGVAEVRDAVDLTSAVTKAYGDTTAGAVQHVADLSLMTVRLGQTDFPQLAAAIPSVTALSESLAVSQEDLFGVMATATGVTGNAAEVSTQFKGVLQALMDPTDSMTQLMKAMGFESGKAMVQQMGLGGTLDAVVGAAEATGAPLSDYIGSMEGVTLATALSGKLSDSLKEKTEAMGDVAGTTAEAFKAQTEGVNKYGFMLDQLAIRGENLGSKFGDALLPVLSKGFDYVNLGIDALEGLIDVFTDLPMPIQTVIIGIGGVAAALGPMAFGIGTVLQILPAFFGAWGAGVKVLTAVGPLLTGTLIPALTTLGPFLLIAAVPVAVWISWDKWGDSLRKTFPIIEDTFQLLYKAGQWIGNELPSLFQSSTKDIVKSNLITRESVKGVAVGLKGEFVSAVDVAKQSLGGMTEEQRKVIAGMRGMSEETRKLLKEEEEQQKIMRKMRDDGALTWGQLAQDVSATNIRMRETTLTLKPLPALSEQTTQAVAADFSWMGDSISESFMKGFTSVKFGMGSLSSFIQSKGQDIAQSIKDIMNPVNIGMNFLMALGSGESGASNARQLTRPVEKLFERTPLDQGFEQGILKRFLTQIFEGKISGETGRGMLLAGQQTWDILSEVFKTSGLSKEEQELVGEAAFNDIFRNFETDISDILDRAFEVLGPSGVAAGGARLGSVDLNIEIHGNVGVDDIAEEIVRALREKGIIP